MEITMSERKSESAALAATWASACCLVPLVVVSIGLGGAWVANNLQAIEPFFRPVFIGAALVALFFAWRRIYRPAAECKPGQVCALPQTWRFYKGIFWVVAALVFVALTFPYLVPLFY